MAATQKQGKGRPSTTREATKRKNGYWARQRTRTNRSILARLDRHIGAHPVDSVARAARAERLRGLSSLSL